MRTTPHAGPAAIKRELWAYLEGRHEDNDRREQIKRDQREVREEIIWQEYQAGEKTVQAIAAENKVCSSTAWRIIHKAEDERRSNKQDDQHGANHGR